MVVYHYSMTDHALSTDVPCILQKCLNAKFVISNLTETSVDQANKFCLLNTYLALQKHFKLLFFGIQNIL